MREIKFRAWDIEEKKFIDKNYGLEISLDGQTSYPHYDSEIEAKVILMQYTGLKDKNGVEIYEGDIVKHDSGWIDEIKWDFITDGGPTCGWGFYDYGDRIAVIGNIYENPELLEDGTHECETDNSAGNVDADGTCTCCGKTDLI